jgi:hypothetical protein
MLSMTITGAIIIILVTYVLAKLSKQKINEMIKKNEITSQSVSITDKKTIQETSNGNSILHSTKYDFGGFKIVRTST